MAVNGLEQYPLFSRYGQFEEYVVQESMQNYPPSVIKWQLPQLESRLISIMFRFMPEQSLRAQIILLFMP